MTAFANKGKMEELIILYLQLPIEDRFKVSVWIKDNLGSLEAQVAFRDLIDAYH